MPASFPPEHLRIGSPFSIHCFYPGQLALLSLALLTLKQASMLLEVSCALQSCNLVRGIRKRSPSRRRVSKASLPHSPGGNRLRQLCRSQFCGSTICGSTKE